MKVLTFLLAALFSGLVVAGCVTPSKPVPEPVPDPLAKVEPHARRRDPPRNLFVLIENPVGKTGEISVGNEQGSQVISQPNLVSEVKNAAASPAAPSRMDEEEIKKIFGAALAAQLPFPVTITLYFKNNLTDFTEESVKSFPGLLAVIRVMQSKDIIVAGHTDRVGTREKNSQLSRKRAERVKEMLIAKGVPPKAITLEWYGEDEPVVKTGDEVPEPKNRRAREVRVR